MNMFQVHVKTRYSRLSSVLMRSKHRTHTWTHFFSAHSRKISPLCLSVVCIKSDLPNNISTLSNGKCSFKLTFTVSNIFLCTLEVILIPSFSQLKKQLYFDKKCYFLCGYFSLSDGSHFGFIFFKAKQTNKQINKTKQQQQIKSKK